MAPITPFNATEISEKSRRDLLLLLEGVRQSLQRTLFLTPTYPI